MSTVDIEPIKHFETFSESVPCPVNVGGSCQEVGSDLLYGRHHLNGSQPFNGTSIIINEGRITKECELRDGKMATNRTSLNTKVLKDFKSQQWNWWPGTHTVPWYLQEKWWPNMGLVYSYGSRPIWTGLPHWGQDKMATISQMTRSQWINSSPPSASYMRRWTGSALAQVMACPLFGAKPLPEPMLSYCQLDP